MSNFDLRMIRMILYVWKDTLKQKEFHGFIVLMFNNSAAYFYPKSKRKFKGRSQLIL